MLNEFGRVGKGNAIAIIEDSEDMRSMLQEFLGSLGYEVHAYNSAEEFLPLAHSARHYFSLLVSDVQMPGLTGLELLERLREKNNSLPVILMTVIPNRKEEQIAASLGACAYLEKPFPLSEFIERVREKVS